MNEIAELMIYLTGFIINFIGWRTSKDFKLVWYVLLLVSLFLATSHWWEMR